MTIGSGLTGKAGQLLSSTAFLPLAVLSASIAVVVLFAFSFLQTLTSEAQTLGHPTPNEMNRIHYGFYLYWYESAGATGYQIQYRTHDGTNWASTWTDLTSHTDTSQPAILTGLTHGTRYQWRIRGTKDGVDPSAWSKHDDDTDPAYTREARSNAPGQPNPPPNPTVTTGPSSLLVAWQAPHAIQGVTVTGYRVEYRWDDENDVERIGMTGILPATPREKTLENLDSRFEYEVWVLAFAGTTKSLGSGATTGTPDAPKTTITITPNSTTRQYGGTDDLSYTVSGLVNGDEPGEVITGEVGPHDRKRRGQLHHQSGNADHSPGIRREVHPACRSDLHDLHNHAQTRDLYLYGSQQNVRRNNDSTA